MQPAIGSAFSGIQSAYGSMASGVALTLRNLFADPTVKIAGRDGTLTYSGGVTSGTGHTGTISPYDGSLVASGDPVMSHLGIPGVGRLPLLHSQGAATNLFLNSQAPATQTITVVAGPVTIYALGSGYTLTSAAGTAVGTGFGAVAMGVSQTLTITTGGTITLTVVGTPVAASVRVEAAPLVGMHLPTAGAAVSRTADVFTWTDFGGTSADGGEFLQMICPYLWSVGAGVAHPLGQVRWLRIQAVLSSERTTTGNANYVQVSAGAGGSNSVSSTGIALASGHVFTKAIAANGGIRLRQNNVASGVTSTVKPYVTGTDALIGTDGTVQQPYSGIGTIYKPGGFTPAERAAWQQLMQKTIRHVA